jgi:hypothetical protein
MRTWLTALRDADQRNMDRVFGALRAPDQLPAVHQPRTHVEGARPQRRRPGPLATHGPKAWVRCA